MTEDRLLSHYERNVISLREQSLEATYENYKHVFSKPVASTDDADKLYMQSIDLLSQIRNKTDTLYPKIDDCGEVVAMGTEDTNACGLLEVGGKRLYEYEPTLIPRKKMRVANEKAVKHVAAGGLHSVALHRDGTVSTWGANDENALGRGEIAEGEEHLIKQMVMPSQDGDGGKSDGEPVKDIIQIGAGDNHTVLLDIHGKVYVCGMYKDTDSGKWRDIELGSGNNFEIKGNHEFPVEVAGFDGRKVEMVCAGNSWNAALSAEDGALYTWGMGNSGQLARTKGMDAKTKKETYLIDGSEKKHPYDNFDLKKLYMGAIHECKDEKTGETKLDKKTKEPVTEYRYNHGKIRENFLTPKIVQWSDPVPKRQVLNISCGDIHLLVVARDPNCFETRVYSSGCSAFGQLGHGSTKDLHQLTPIEALDKKYVCKVAAGNAHSLALSMDGKNCYSWGRINEGALGLYDEEKTNAFQQTDFQGTPTQIAFPTDLGDSLLIDIIAGESTSFAITNLNTVYSWGYNENSQTGHYCDSEMEIISRPRLLNVIESVNNAIKSEKKKVVAKNCRVIRVAGGGQHSLMVIKRYL